jgi:hypothetical protein
MIRNLLRKLTGRQTIVTAKVYFKDLTTYRRAHPESLEKEREQIQRWLAYVKSRSEQETNNEGNQEAKTNEARAQLREVARLAFMLHPAATQDDFRRCWPSIRDEILKQHCLEELAANPALTMMVETRSSKANGTRIEEKLQSTNLHLMKGSGRSD